MSLALFNTAGNLPPARRNLLQLNDRIESAEHQLDTLRSGRSRLEGELAKAADAKAELQALVNDDAATLVDRLRQGGQWLLSSFGNARAHELSAALSDSRIQAAVGEAALSSIADETATLEREISELKLRRPDVVRAAVREAAGGLYADFDTIVDHLREAMVRLRGLELYLNIERIPARTVAELPDFRFADGLPQMAVVAPTKEVAKAAASFADFAAAIENDALASADKYLDFPPLESIDDPFITYENLSDPERHRVDARSAGLRLTGVPREAAE